MNKAIVIVGKPDRAEWLKQCIESINYTRYPTIVVNEYAYELGRIEWIYKHTDIDEFLLLQDSVVLKHSNWLDEVFDFDGSVSLSNAPFLMYMGKYRREILDKIEMPKVTSKAESVRLEADWTKIYVEAEDKLKIISTLRDSTKFKKVFGRKNMVIEDDNLIKYKHIWDASMIYEY